MITHDVFLAGVLLGALIGSVVTYVAGRIDAKLRR